MNIVAGHVSDMVDLIDNLLKEPERKIYYQHLSSDCIDDFTLHLPDFGVVFSMQWKLGSCPGATSFVCDVGSDELKLIGFIDKRPKIIIGSAQIIV